MVHRTRKARRRLSINGFPREFNLPPGYGPPIGLAPGRDGDIWFSEEFQSKLGHATNTGSITEFPTTFSLAFGPLASGPGARAWFPDRDHNAFVALAADGTAQLHPIPGGYPATFAAITFDANNELWYIQSNSQRPRIVRYNPAKLTEYKLPRDLATISTLVSAGGYLYFAEGGRLARLETSDGHVDEFPLAEASKAPNEIVRDRDGNIWFDEYPGSRIGWLSPTGKLTECDLPVEDQGGFAIDRAGKAWVSTKVGVAEVIPCHRDDTSIQPGGVSTPYQ